MPPACMSLAILPAFSEPPNSCLSFQGQGEESRGVTSGTHSTELCTPSSLYCAHKMTALFVYTYKGEFRKGRFFPFAFLYIHIWSLRRKMAYPGCPQPEMSTPVLCYRLSLAKPRIPFFLLQLLGSSLLMIMPDLLIWNIVFFFFWSFWVSALIAELWPMTIYNRQFYSKVFQKCPCSSKCMHNDLLCPGSC